ncbi:MAG: DNA-binding protein [Ruminococcaceae bacterium]|nr:DNA-binding protein [Oscillospiraceae bacterium]
MHEKDLGISEYLDLYGNILDERRLQIMDMYFNEDYSLSEISEITGITRQGISDSIRKSSKKLLEMEEKLHLKSRIEYFEENRNNIVDELQKLLDDTDITSAIIEKIRNLAI